MNAPDVVIVGSGPAGISAAWPLVRVGLRVLMLDASSGPAPASPTHPSLADFRSDPDRWKTAFGADLAGLAVGGDVSPKFATPLARHALRGFDRGVETNGFMAAGSLGQGGLSAIWGGLAAPFAPDDMEGFPFRPDALAPHYRAAAERIGLQMAEPTHAAARAMLAKHQDGDDFSLSAAPNAVHQDACVACGLCLYGCARGAIYNAADELPALRRRANFSYRSGARVRRLGREGLSQVIELDGERITAPVVVLAAGTIATTGLALGRLQKFGQPVRLLSNPAAATAFLAPGLVGRPAAAANAMSLGQLFFRLGAQDRSAGVIYGADGLPLSLVADRLPLSRPAALRVARLLAPALLPATLYLPGSYSDNAVMVGEDGRVVIHGRRTPEAEARLRQDVALLKKRLSKLGVVGLPGSTALLEPGADVHYAGTLPMGAAGGTTIEGELNDAPGVFIADGASLPRLPAVHLTLTVMANAARIGEGIAARHRREAAA